MFFEPKVVFENSSTQAAIVMTIFEVFLETLRVVKMPIAVLAVRVATTFDPMLLQTIPCWKVFVAIIAEVMIAGICFMLPKRMHATEIAVAAGAERHLRYNDSTEQEKDNHGGMYGTQKDENLLTEV